MEQISVIILTKNEEKNIEKCIKSLGFCDEILIVDDISIDKTLQVVKKIKDPRIVIFEHSKKDDFSTQRNFSLNKAKNKWVLFVDADEIVSENLAREISLKIHNDLFNGYFIKRRDNMWGVKLMHGECGKLELVRLGQKKMGKWKGRVHEEWIIDGRIGRLDNFLEHYPHQNIREFIREIDYYSNIRSHELFEKKINTNLLEILIYPKIKFFQNYFLKLGVLDGVPGFIVAVSMSLHSFLVRVKLYLLWNKK